MILRRLNITNFKGVNGTASIELDSFNAIVGQNDAGKSTILLAIDAVLNNKTLIVSDLNVSTEETELIIELIFDCLNQEYRLGEEILTTIESEELTNDEGHLVWKKIWRLSGENLSKPKTYIVRKKYDEADDFVFKTEAQLIAQCTTNEIATSKGNGDDYNNVEKREKLRAFNLANNIAFQFEDVEIPSSGTTKVKAIGDSIKKALPSFQYFRADTSLSDTDTTIQKFFKDMAFNLIREAANTEQIETSVITQLETVLERVTDKINDVVKSTEKVEPKVSFDWSKLISTSFVSTSSGDEIPLSSRGDGFRRITMMAYFEYLAEMNKTDASQKLIFGFEEPETFLHPSAQENLFEKLNALTQNGYQVLTSTHSPTIVGNTKRENIIHISNPESVYTVTQEDVDYKALALDLGIKPDNTFTPLFSTSRLLFLVEGISDVVAMHHQANLYKQNNLIESTFDDLSINIIPIGGCGEVKHWVNLDLFTKLGKPYFILLDSDKDNAEQVSPNLTALLNYNLVEGTDFQITKKRLLENYIHPTAIERLVPGCNLAYGDFDHAKNLCKSHPDSVIRGRLGGKGVAEKHYPSLTFDELKMTWDDGNEDEFMTLYQVMVDKLNA
jgi:predicted ATP-dependent endonuclease of OLD family